MGSVAGMSLFCGQIMFKSRCDNKLADITEQAAAEKREVRAACLCMSQASDLLPVLGTVQYLSGMRRVL